MSTQEKELRERFAKLQREGVTDIKFSFGPLAETTREAVCTSVTTVLTAVERGEYKELPAAKRPAKKI